MRNLGPRTTGLAVGGYPLYQVVTVDGFVEVVEHRQPGPVFSISDDPDNKDRTRSNRLTVNLREHELAVMAVASTIVPAWRAAAVNPIVALRAE